MGFQDECNEFLQYCAVERRQSEHTISAYRFDLLDFERWLSSKDTATINQGDLKLYLEDMVTGRKLSVATVRRRLACLRGFFRRRTALRGVQDPFESWQPKLPRQKRLPRALARSEVRSLLGPTCNPEMTPDFQTAICLMVATGLRVGELCRLRLEDISPDGATIRIHGKGSRDRIAYVTDRPLRRAITRVATKRRLADGDNAPLFVNRLGAAIRSQSIRTKLQLAAAHCGIQRRVTPHMLRHTAATLLIETGVDIRFVQRLLGHSSIATTEIYTHVTDEALRSTLERADVLANLGR